MPSVPSAAELGLGRPQRAPQSVGRVRVGANPAQFANGQAAGQVARGAAVAAQVSDNVARRLMTREDTASRIKAEQEFDQFARDEFDRFSTEGDLGDPTQVQAFNTEIAKRREEIQTAYRGSDEGKAKLENRLSQAAFSFENFVTGKAIEEQQRVINQHLGKELSTLSKRAYEGPLEFDAIAQMAEDEIAGMAGSLTTAQSEEYTRTLVSEIANSSLQGMMDRGDLAEMEEFLEGPRVGSNMTSLQMNKWQSQIGQRRRVQEEAMQAGQREVQRVASILGVDPSELPPAARFQIAGLRVPEKKRTKADEIAEIEGILGPLSQAQKAKHLGVDVAGPQPLTDAGKAVQEMENFKNLYGADSVQVQELQRLQDAPSEPPDLSSIGGMRKEFTGLSKQFVESKAAFDRIQSVASDGTAASDMALIFNYMKMLDPGSTVREGEFATAQNAGGVDTRIINFYNNARDGTLLNEKQRGDFLERASDLFGSQINAQRLLEGQFTAIADRAGINPEDVAIDFVGGAKIGETFGESSEPAEPVIEMDAYLSGGG